MSNAIKSFETLYNNPFIFVPLFSEFYASVGKKTNGILLAYLVLPLCLHPTTRPYFRSANKRSTIHIFAAERNRLYGLPERINHYRMLTNTTLQHGLNLQALRLQQDLSVQADAPLAYPFCPADSARAARNLGRLLTPLEIPAVFRVLGIKHL